MRTRLIFVWVFMAFGVDGVEESRVLTEIFRIRVIDREWKLVRRILDFSGGF